MAGQNSTMFSTMARLLCTPSLSSLCIKRSVKRTNYIIKSLLAHAWPKFNNVLHNGQAVVHTVSLLSVYTEMRKKDKLYYKEPPNTRMAQVQQCSLQWPGCCAHHLLPLCGKHKKDKLYYKKHPGPSSKMFSPQMARLLCTPSPFSLCRKKSIKRDKLYYKKPPDTSGPSSTMFSTMARLLCTPSPSSLCTKKSKKGQIIL
jgi:hypothetical protein